VSAAQVIEMQVVVVEIRTAANAGAFGAQRARTGITLRQRKRQYLTDSVVVALTSGYKIVNIRFSSSGRGRQGILWRDVLGKWVLGFRWTVL